MLKICRWWFFLALMWNVLNRTIVRVWCCLFTGMFHFDAHSLYWSCDQPTWEFQQNGGFWLAEPKRCPPGAGNLSRIAQDSKPSTVFEFFCKQNSRFTKGGLLGERKVLWCALFAEKVLSFLVTARSCVHINRTLASLIRHLRRRRA